MNERVRSVGFKTTSFIVVKINIASLKRLKYLPPFDNRVVPLYMASNCGHEIFEFRKTRNKIIVHGVYG